MHPNIIRAITDVLVSGKEEVSTQLREVRTAQSAFQQCADMCAKWGQMFEDDRDVLKFLDEKANDLQQQLEAYQKVSTFIQEQCEKHDWRYTGHDHRDHHFTCTHCGKEEAW